MAKFLMAALALFALLAGWLAVQRLARRMTGPDVRTDIKDGSFGGCGCGTHAGPDQPDDRHCS